jgi:hypothetical protein
MLSEMAHWLMIAGAVLVLQDDGRFLILLVTAMGVFASIAGIVSELGVSFGKSSVCGFKLSPVFESALSMLWALPAQG